MSLLTLAASASQPSYPSKYIVYYRGKEMPEAPSTDAEATTMAGTASTAEEDPLLFADRKDRPREDWMKEVESVVTGHVGYTYGDPSHAAGGGDLLLGWVILGLFFFILIALPYILIHALTGFQKRESTVTQRSWTLSAPVLGQVIILVLFLVTDRIRNFIQKLVGFGFPQEISECLTALLLSAPTMGMFVTVTGMILQDDICTRI